ncbi:MAG: CoB--CoM heterodisulfide reductase iron-sulfur subunit B family protein, partial [Deltaproteobacteria bacterium]|nr:CoB--CoM heterodisulfide reductase iron-sulfur subunit B family protein [Deltaproteobacteria bacterium]
WTCCGASAAESVSQLLSLALPARNLALAEKMGEPGEILVPCSACYLNLKKVEEKIRKDPDVHRLINEILSAEQLTLTGTVRVRHLLDVLVNDLDPDTIQSRLKRPLTDLIIAPYYGCQCLRPYPVFDDPEVPTSMEGLLTAAGARIHPWTMGGSCCGASQMNTHTEIALEKVGNILQAAQGANVIVTVCPMCQMNLEAYQKRASTVSRQNLGMTILYLPQLLGLAIGLAEKKLRMDLNLSITSGFRDDIERISVPA